MISPKLRALQRQFETSQQAAAPQAQGADGRIFMALQSAIQQEADQLIAEAEAKQKAAEAECETLHEKIIELQNELIRVQADYKEHLASMKEESAGEYAKTTDKHNGEMADMHGRLTTACCALEEERTLRIQAEAQLKAMGDMHQHMKEMMGKLQPVQKQAPAPIIPPAAPAKPFPFKLIVSARDANGRIAEITSAPTT